MTSLDGAARIIGLPGKDGVDGSQVEGLFHAGQLEALRRYCLSDVAQTAFLFLRYRLVSGDLDRDGYRHAASGLLAALETDGRFGRLLDGVDRRRLLLGDVSATARPVGAARRARSTRARPIDRRARAARQAAGAPPRRAARRWSRASSRSRPTWASATPRRTRAAAPRRAPRSCSARRGSSTST